MIVKGKLYFYKKTLYPKGEVPDCYNIWHGIAGYKFPKAMGHPLIVGTTDELMDYLEKAGRPRLDRRNQIEDKSTVVL